MRRRLQFHRYLNREARALAFFALDGDVAAEEEGEFPDDGEASAGAAVLSGGRHVNLAELGEDIFERFVLHADAGVGDD